MRTHCNPDPFGLAAVEGRSVVAAFDGGAMASEAGALRRGCAPLTGKSTLNRLERHRAPLARLCFTAIPNPWCR